MHQNQTWSKPVATSAKKKDGSERLNFTAFYEALLEAKGVSLGGEGAVGKGGRKLSYVAKVQGNGNLLVGKAYTAMMELEPGAEFEIKLSKKVIKLIPVGGSDEEDEAPRGLGHQPSM